MASKTTPVNISGTIFHMTEDSYKMFNDYLNSVKKYFEKHEGKDEIMGDLESRMAEHFSEKLSPGKQVLLEEDVKALIEVMGRVEDFAAEEGDRDDEELPKVNKRFFRDPENRIIAGVCAGLANYFNADATIIRLIFLVSIFFGGLGILVYALLWIFIPEAQTTSEKEAMAGYRFDLATIAKDVEEKVKDIKVPKRFSEKMEKVFKILGQIIMALLQAPVKVLFFILKLVSIFVTPVLILATVAFTLLVLSLAFHLSPYFIELPLDALANRFSFYLFLTGVYMAGLVIFIALISVFMSPIKKRWLFSAGKGVALISLFLIGAFLAGLGILDLGPRAEALIKEGLNNQRTTSETFSALEPFTEIIVEHPLREVTVIHGEKQSVELITDERCKGIFEPVVWNNRLQMNRKEVLPYTPFCDAWGAKAVITMPSLTFFGSWRHSQNTIQGFELDELYIILRNAHLTLQQGSVKILSADLSTHSRLFVSDFSAQEATIQVNDDAEAEVEVVNELKVAPFDRGVIRYHGDPQLSLTGRDGVLNPEGGVISLDGHALKFNTNNEEGTASMEDIDEPILSMEEGEPLISVEEGVTQPEALLPEEERPLIWSELEVMAIPKDCKYELKEVLGEIYGDWIFSREQFSLSQSDLRALPISNACIDKVIEKVY